MNAIEFIDGLRNASAGEIVDAFSREIGRLGFTQFIITRTEIDKSLHDLMLHFRGPQEFIDLYDAREYIKIDPTYQRAKLSSLPFMWNGKDYSGDRRFQEIMDLRIQFGCRQGLVVPLHGPNGLYGRLGLAGTEAVELPPGTLPHLYMAAMFTIESARVATPHSLNRHEEELLKYKAFGLSSAQCADKLQMPERTIRAQLQSVRIKLGATTNCHAVAIAVRDKLVEL
jgi:DNA-binding CsgD family transcriptional regulator